MKSIEKNGYICKTLENRRESSFRASESRHGIQDSHAILKFSFRRNPGKKWMPDQVRHDNTVRIHVALDKSPPPRRGRGRAGVIPESISQLFLFSFFPVFILFLFLTGNGLAAESKLIPSAAFKQEYNDNIFLDSEGGQRDFITTVSPALEWIERVEQGSLRLFGRLDWLTYWQNGEFDATDYLYQGDFQYRLSARVSIGAGAGGSRDSRPDRDLETTGLILGTAPRDRWFYNISGSFQLSERSSLGFRFNQSKEDFESPQFSDSRGYDGSLQFTQAMTETLQGRASIYYANYSYETSETKVLGMNLGADWTLTEKWSLIFDLGVRYTASEFLVRSLEFVPPFFVVQVSKEESRDRYGGVGLASLTYRGESSGLSLTFQQDITPSSGTGATRSSSLRLQMDRRFTYELHGFLAASYVLTQADAGEFSSNETDVQTANFNARLRYTFTNDMALEASYLYSRAIDRIADTVAGRNLFLLRFYIQHDLLER
jgi:hypothetical protein